MSATLDDQDTSYQDYQDQIEQRQLPIQPYSGMAGATPGAPAAPTGFRPTGPGVLSPSGGPAGPQAGQPQQQTALPAFHTSRKWTPDKDDPIVGAGYQFAPPPPESEGKGSYVGDMFRQIWASTLQDADAAVGIAAGVANQLKADPSTQQWIQDQRKALAAHVEATIRDMSPERQLAARSSLMAWMGGDKDADGNRIPAPGEGGWPNYVGLTVASLVPDAALAFLGGYFLGPVGLAAIFGAKGMGSTYNAISDRLEKIPTKELAQSSPVYQELRQQGMDDQQARLELLRKTAPLLVSIGGAAGAVTGVGLGRTITGQLEQKIGTTALRRLGVGAIEGGVPMGVQGGVDPAVQQTFEQEVGQRQGYDYGQIAAGAVSGAVGGAAMGAGFSVLRGPHTPAPKPTAEPGPQTSTVDPAQQEALSEALTPNKPAAPSPLAGTSDPNAQGDLFRRQSEMFPGQELGRPPQEPQIAGVQPGMAESATQGDLFAPSTQVSAPPPQQASFDFGPRPEVTQPGPQTVQPEVAQSGPPSSPTVAAGEGPPPTSPARGAPPAAQASAAAPKTPTKAPTRALSRTQLTKALVEAGQDPKELASQSLGDLRAMHEAIGHEAIGHEALTTVRNPEATKPEQVAPVEGATPPVVAEQAGTETAPRTDVRDTTQPAAQPTPRQVATGEVPATAGESVAQKRARLKAEMQAKVAAKTEAEAVSEEPTARALPADRPVSEADVKHIATAEEIAATAKQAPGYVEPMRSVQAKAPEVEKPGGRPLTRAERAAQMKAKLAPAGERMKGQGAVAEATTETDGERQTQIRKDTLAKALPGEIRKAVQVNKGAPVDQLINQLVQNLHGVLSKSDASPEAVTELLTKWADRMPAGKLPGTSTAPREIAEHLINRFGKREETRADREKAAEIAEHAREEGPADYEKEGKAYQAAIEDRAAEGGGERMEKAELEHEVTSRAEEAGEHEAKLVETEAPEEVERKAAEDLQRRATNLIDNLNDGKKSVHEAAAEFGKQGEGAGRKRRAGLENFERVLEGEIARAQDPAEIDRWIKRVDAEQKDTIRQSSGAYDKSEGSKAEWLKQRNARRARTLAIQRKGERLGPAYAEKVRGWLRELTDPVGVAADREADKAGAKQLPWTPAHGIDPLSSRYVRTSLDQRMGQGLADAIHASERYDAPFTLNDALRHIRNSTLLGNEARPMQMLATQLMRLRSKMPDIRVFSMDRAIEDGHIPPDSPLQGAYGFYNMMTGKDPLSRGFIALNTRIWNRHGNLAQTLLHEASHSVTAHMIEAMIEHEKTTGETPAELGALRSIHAELQRHVEQAEGLTMQQRENLDYALTDPHELHTMLMTDPTVQAFAASRQASPQLLAELRQAGFLTGSQPKSVWRTFVDWTRRALGLRAPASASEYALLDHILAPVTEIADRSARYNERLLPKDPELRPMAAETYHATVNAFAPNQKAREGFNWVARTLNLATLGDKARRAVLQGMTRDAIVDRYKDLLGKGLTDFRTADENIARTQKTFFDDHADRINAMVNRYNQNPEAIKLGQLMTDATRNEVRLGETDPGANSHLTTKDEQAALKDLTARYNALSPESRAIYQAFKNTYKEFYKLSRDAELTSLFRGAVPDGTAAQLDAFRQTVRTGKSLEAFLKKPENADIDSAFGADKAREYRDILRGVAKIYSQGHVQGDYFPLRRSGEYVLTYGHAGEENHGVEMFHSIGEAEARRVELNKAGEENVSQVMNRRTNPLNEILPHHPMVDELVQQMRKNPKLRGQAEDVRNLLNSVLLEHLDRRTASNARMRRKGVRGALADHGRILANEFLNTGGRLGHYLHGQDRLDALSTLRERVSELGRSGEPGQALLGGAVLHELQERATTIENPSNLLASLVAKANQYSYALNVMSPSHMLTSSVEAHSNAMPMLSARHGHIQSGLALTRAMTQAAPKMLTTGAKNTLAAMGNKLKASDWNLGHYVRDKFVEAGANQAHMNRLFAELENAGLIDHTMSKDIQLLANPTGVTVGKARTAWKIFTDMNAAGAHAVDVMNKGAISKAAFDLEMRKSQGDVDKSITYAIDTARKAMPNYNLGNKARIATTKGAFGPLGSPMMQFKNYGFHELGVLANLAKQSFAKLPSEERTEARWALAGVLATRAMMAGSLTLIADPIRYVMGAYDKISGADKPHDYQADVRQWVASWAGPELGAVLTRGLPYLIGMDIHRRVGLANILEIPELESFDGKGMLKAAASAFFGASGENAANISEGLSKLANGDVGGWLKTLAPRPIRQAMQAINLANNGLQDSRGQTILSPDKISPLDVAYQAAGFQPARISEFREGRNAVIQKRDELKTERTRLVNQWLSAAPADRPTIMHQIHDWSQENGERITMAQLLKAERQRRKQSNAPFGLKLPRRGGAALAETGDFAAY